jgi:nitrogen fixation protein NifQ
MRPSQSEAPGSLGAPAAPRPGRPALRAFLLQRAVAAPGGAELPVLALAGALALAWHLQGFDRLPLIGLDAAETRVLIGRHFPGAEDELPLAWAALAHRGDEPERADEIADVIALLLDGAAATPQQTRWLAHAVGTACLGADHLWQDLGLPSRDALSTLLLRHFPFVAQRNTGNMKWKKFFYKLLCERAGLRLCRAPSCAACADRAACFGPEH